MIKRANRQAKLVRRFKTGSPHRATEASHVSPIKCKAVIKNLQGRRPLRYWMVRLVASYPSGLVPRCAATPHISAAGLGSKLGGRHLCVCSNLLLSENWATMDLKFKILLGAEVERLCHKIEHCGGDPKLERELTELLDQCTQMLMLSTLERPAAQLQH
jgi:hypothetical protein